MIISLDYDDTFTKDVDFWLEFVKNAQTRGHIVYCITFRYIEECDDLDPRLTALVKIIPTGRKAKRTFASTQGINVDVWIDDQPDFIVYGQ
jgi:hypothetical protein